MIDVDISNIWGEISLPDLLAVEAEISVAHQTLMEGTGADGGMRGWLNLPMEEPSAEICRLLNVAARIQENSDVLVVLGSCSACLGARGAVELLRDVTRNADSEADGIEIFFGGDSFSTHRWNALMKLLDGKNFSVCVIAVSAFPLETSVWFRNLRWILERRYGTEEARKRVYTVTGTQEGVLRAMSGKKAGSLSACRKIWMIGLVCCHPRGCCPWLRRELILQKFSRVLGMRSGNMTCAPLKTRCGFMPRFGA